MNLLAIDVGNTATCCGIYDVEDKARHPRPAFVATIGTPSLLKSRVFARFLVREFKKRKISARSFQGAIVASVVPFVDAALRRELRTLFDFQVPFVSARTPSQVKVRTRVPSEVGADRIVNARAALEWSRGGAIVVDFGTATTFDCVTARGVYLGGVIAPGPVISAEALYRKTAKLPMVLLEKPARILGRSTLESIQSGLYHGYRGLVKEIVSRLKKKMGARTRVFATGGQAQWILNGLDCIDRHIPHLTLEGLLHTWLDTNLVIRFPLRSPQKETA